jgi:MFS transporter, DHA2 family, multidrug resistance protein
MKPDATRALAAALPADLSHSPVLGILVVNMGAGIATLAARFLSLGLADLKGHLGIGVDEGAWIGTAFNAATMFIGPLTVYLGALLGTRPVLLVCASVFAVASACLPFAHSYGVLILLMVIAGLSSGTFYPLTLSFALQNIPLRYLAVTLGLYATCIEGALNFAPSLYGFYRNQWSWEWMFWTSAIAAPVMAACAYYGIPAPSRQGHRDRHRASPDSCTPAPASHSCSPRSTRDSGSTGGAPACSRRYSRPESSSSFARRFVV